jgi:hypothetical protein
MPSFLQTLNKSLNSLFMLRHHHQMKRWRCSVTLKTWNSVCLAYENGQSIEIINNMNKKYFAIRQLKLGEWKKLRCIISIIGYRLQTMKENWLNKQTSDSIIAKCQIGHVKTVGWKLKSTSLPCMQETWEELGILALGTSKRHIMRHLTSVDKDMVKICFLSYKQYFEHYQYQSMTTFNHHRSLFTLSYSHSINVLHSYGFSPRFFFNSCPLVAIQ